MERSRTGILGLAIAGLVIAIAIVPSLGVAAEITVDTFDNGAGSSTLGERTLLWAINESNSNGEGFNTIVFDFTLAELVAADKDNTIEGEPKEDNVITFEITLSPDAILEITTELTIDGNDLVAAMGGYFFDIVKTDSIGNAGLAFITREDLTLINVGMRADALVANRTLNDPDDTIDIIFEIGINFVHDITGEIKEFYFNNPRGEEMRLVKTGFGELALLAKIETPADGIELTYTGGTLLVDGVLRTDTDSLEGDIEICANSDGSDGFTSSNCDRALLIFEMPSLVVEGAIDPRPNPPVNGTYAGNITGDIDGTGTASLNGKVIKTGVGSLTLTGTNTYVGGTYIFEGEVIGDTDAIQGDVYICPGIASIEKLTDEVGKPSLVCNDDPGDQAQLTFDISTDSTFGGTLNGQGIVAKDGAAKLTLVADQTNFGGNLEINSGVLELDTVLGTDGIDEVDVAVNNGGTLSGSGTITGSLEVKSGGIFDLTDQKLTVSGTSAKIADGGVIAIHIDGTTTPGSLVVANTVILDGGAVGVDFDADYVDTLTDGDPPISYTIIDARNPIDSTEILTGGSSEDGILHSNALFKLSLEYIDNPSQCFLRGVCRVNLVTEFEPMLVDDAVTNNQKAIARVLDAAYDCANSIGGCVIDMDLATDFRDLYGDFAVTSEEIPDILDTIAGEEYAAFSDVRSAATARFNRSISRRFDLEFTVASDADAESSEGNESEPAVGDVSAPGPTWKALGSGARNTRSYRDYRNSRNAWRRQGRPLKDPMPIARHSGKGGFTAWLDVHGVFGELGGGSNADDIDYSIFGPLFGLDYGVSEHITMGVTMGYTRNEMNTPGSATKGSGDTFQGGAYVGAVFESFHLVGSFRYAYSDLEARRRVRFNTLDRTATADFDAHDTSVFLEAAYHFKPMGNVIIQPMISLAYDHLDQASFDENGAGSLNLQIDKQVFDTVQTSLGVRIAMFGRDTEGRYLLPQFRIAYEREWLDNDRSMSATLPTAGPMGAFQIKGAALPRDRVVIGVSSEVGVSDRINLFVDYDLRAGTDLLEHSLAFGFRAIW